MPLPPRAIKTGLALLSVAFALTSPLSAIADNGIQVEVRNIDDTAGPAKIRITNNTKTRIGWDAIFEPQLQTFDRGTWGIDFSGIISALRDPCARYRVTLPHCLAAGQSEEILWNRKLSTCPDQTSRIDAPIKQGTYRLVFHYFENPPACDGEQGNPLDRKAPSGPVESAPFSIK